MNLEGSHPPRESFGALIHGAASPDETRDIVRHLLAGCPSCCRRAEEARTFTPPEPMAAKLFNYDPIFDRIEKQLAESLQRREAERESAPELYAELLRHEAIEGLIQVHSTRRYASLALCELLLQKSRDLCVKDPGQAQEAAELALAAAEQLDFDLYGAPVVQDLRATAWAYFADTRRIQADLRSAETSLMLAEHLIEEGSGDPLSTAELLSLKASFHSHGGRFEEAVRLLNRAASIYRRAGDRHLLGRTLVKKGTVVGNSGEPEIAARMIRRGIDLLDLPREPRLMVCAIHNLIWFLHESGRTGQAAACVDGTRQLYRRARDRRHLGRLRWLEGKLAVRGEEAEGALLEARDSLTREGLHYEAALAAMDLAVLYAGECRGREMRRQADQMLPLFRSGDMYRETVVALLSFQQTQGKVGTAGLLRELGDHLRRARDEKNPKGLAPVLMELEAGGLPAAR